MPAEKWTDDPEIQHLIDESLKRTADLRAIEKEIFTKHVTLETIDDALQDAEQKIRSLELREQNLLALWIEVDAALVFPENRSDRAAHPDFIWDLKHQLPQYERDPQNRHGVRRQMSVIREEYYSRLEDLGRRIYRETLGLRR